MSKKNGDPKSEVDEYGLVVHKYTSTVLVVVPPSGYAETTLRYARSSLFNVHVGTRVVSSQDGAVLRGEHAIVERTRFEVTHSRAGRELLRERVLNDAVITKGSALARLIELEALVDGVLVSSYRSDGLLVATPTGSTAYNLSAGGPILMPGARVYVVTPICPHTLTQRPLVLPDDREILVRLRSPEDATLTLDGQVGATLKQGDEVRVVKARESARFVSTPPHDHFETLRTKLGWGSR